MQLPRGEIELGHCIHAQKHRKGHSPSKKTKANILNMFYMSYVKCELKRFIY